ncbi:TMV resistance protein N-like [Macadamia integrifolia]|uniref:TMV resistance protein N-like n=1 Tax=Macadamia integrifolia TaxID=60698 RepID=UPI001C52E9BF|nr:TMV resistance protein N-like [Macadamia integrifolia]
MVPDGTCSDSSMLHFQRDKVEIVELVSKRVLDELVRSIYLAECKHPIGIDSRVEDLLSLLSNGSHDVQFIGICGWSGIGKTTIAKAVYNRYCSAFNKHSFISDVSKQAKQCTDLASLQQRELKDIFKTDFDIGHDHRGKKLMEERFCKENVLLILDDVDSKEQLDALASEFNWFGQGSRIIITTKDEYILNVAKIDNEKIYWPQELDHHESLQLFSLHAFSKDDPPEDYMKLSHNIVRYSRGVRVLSVRYKRQRRVEKNIAKIESRIFGGCLDLNHSMSTERDRNKRFTIVEIRATISKLMGGCLDPNGSVATDIVGKGAEKRTFRRRFTSWEIKTMAFTASGWVLVSSGLVALSLLTEEATTGVEEMG